MISQIDSLYDNAMQELEQKPLDLWHKEFLGKNGHISTLNRSLKGLPKEEKATYGKKLQAIKQKLQEKYHQMLENQPKSFLQYDFTAVKYSQKGKQHPMSFIKKQISHIFTSQGFFQNTGPDIETEYYNFDALNTTKEHPSRSMRDTFYLKSGKLLRTQTTAVQTRILEQKELPIKTIIYGNVYRRDDDATHTPMFTQLEGLVVDKNLTVHHLKSWIMSFLHQLLPNITDIRFRPSFFPFTYLSAEVDIKLKNKNQWLELLGCGMVHPNILKNFDINPDLYQGLAFGLGVERLAMLRFDIDDIRHLYSNDTEFLDSIAY